MSLRKRLKLKTERGKVKRKQISIEKRNEKKKLKRGRQVKSQRKQITKGVKERSHKRRQRRDQSIEGKRH